MDKVAVILTLIWSFLPCHQPFGFGSSAGPLYTSQDKGLTLVDHSNISQTIHESDTAWMVEFYSSWCGHCIRFAPIYKELGQAVEGTSTLYV